MAHTPGPWTAKFGTNNGWDVVAANAKIAIEPWSDGMDGDWNKTSIANARLIAAAPETAAERDRLRAVNADLLAALNGMITLFNESGDVIETDAGHRLCDAARAAIARAEGR